MPRGRPPKTIDPHASCAHRLGFEVRCARTGKGLTLEALADRVGFTPQHISQVELAETCPSEDFVAIVDRALDAGGRLLALYPDVLGEHVRERQRRASLRREFSSRKSLRCPQEVDEDVRRRDFIGLGLAVALLGPDVGKASADDWDRIAHAWGYEITTVPDRSTLLPGLFADLKRLEANGGPQRAIAQLSSFVAMIMVSTGSAEQARVWWRRAQVAANASGDTVLRAGVMGHHSVEGVFGLHSPNRVLALADQALAVTDEPCIGRIRAFSARVRALALQGRAKETRRAVRALEAEFERLPRSVTSEKVGVDGWSEEDLHNAVSFAGAFTDIEGGEAARNEALRLYSSALWRGPTQVRMHRAMTEMDPVMAVEVLSPLTDAQRKDRFVRLVALKALNVCESRNVRGTSELREVLA